MTRIVVDTGPLVALLNRRDRHHAWIREVLDTLQPPISTCEAVVSEACFLLRRFARGPDALLALHLRLAPGAPLLRSVAVNVDAAGQPIEFGTTWFAGDRVTLTVSPEGADAGKTVDKLS